eukprot:INCI7266.3.p3 GENE.INCI7266.3~~INCI7266.3.p3  ORF type:complete len:495 (-),score=92.83 INCI7266.3:3927-5411(-)
MAPHPDKTIRKTKIVCTIGPASWSPDMLLDMMDAGMNVCRLNFSHGDHEGHGGVVDRIREACAKRALEGKSEHIAIMLDTKGPEIRTGFFADGAKTIDLVAGQDLELHSADYSFKGDNTKIAVTYKAMPQTVKVGQTILAADGSLVLTVKEILPDGVMTTVTNSCTIGERKNMNLPGVIVDLPTVTEKDKDDLINFGLKYEVDMIALSFVRKGSDITHVRELLGPRGASIKLIAKIENQEGLDNYDDILKEVDGIMVARGDLGMEIPPEKVFLAQKMMISKANVAGKTVITATQMLESMIQNPRPTRAECTDVANAVLDGTDCVMLSGESAGGAYPLNAVQVMGNICIEAESILDYDRTFQFLRTKVLAHGPVAVGEAVAASAVNTAVEIHAAMIVVLTETGRTASLIAKYRPSAPILVLTPSAVAARQCESLLRGTRSYVMGSMIGSEAILHRAADIGKSLGWCTAGDNIIGVHGVMEGVTGHTNLLKVLQVQ